MDDINIQFEDIDINREEQDGFVQVGSRVKNQKFIIIKSSKNQEFSSHVLKVGSNIKNLFLKISNQVRIKIFQIPFLSIKQESRYKI